VSIGINVYVAMLSQLHFSFVHPCRLWRDL